MRMLEDIHKDITQLLEEVNDVDKEMRASGFGGSDFRMLYVTTQLIPTIWITLDLEK